MLGPKVIFVLKNTVLSLYKAMLEVHRNRVIKGQFYKEIIGKLPF